MLAKALANLASNHSMDSNFDSPYSLEARSKVTSFFRYNHLIQIHLCNEKVKYMFMLIMTLVQGFDVPLWRKILGMKLTGTTLLYFLQPLKLKLKKKKNHFSLMPWLIGVFCWAGGKLDDITVVVGLVVSSWKFGS